jgi:hypothetical protein
MVDFKVIERIAVYAFLISKFSLFNSGLWAPSFFQPTFPVTKSQYINNSPIAELNIKIHIH